MINILTEAEIADLERFSFGDSPELANTLLALVLSGIKTGTCWPVRDGQLTEIGKRMVACDGIGRPRGVIETVTLQQRVFSEVDAEFAAKEGEGDRSLEYWREAHEGYFTRNGGFEPDMLLWCEEFRLIATVEPAA